MKVAFINMLKYVFHPSDKATARPWYNASDTEERNAKARKAYEALMTVTLRKPTSPEYRNFSREVKARASQMYTNFTYGEQEVSHTVTSWEGYCDVMGVIL